MGCGCSKKDIDHVAPPHKPYTVPPGASHSKDKAARKEAHVVPKGSDDSFIPQSSTSARAAQASNERATARPSSTSKPTSQAGHAQSGKAKADEEATDAGNLDAILLEQGSYLQGLIFRPWDEKDEDIASNFGRSPAVGSKTAPKAKFEDADGLLELSSRQREALHAWQRFPDLGAVKGGTPPAVIASVPASGNIRQGLVGDCSFLSALSVLAEYEQKFRQPVLTGIIYPREHGKPAFNECGHYGCRLFLNGTMRKVVVDDRVPVRSNGQPLCAHSARSHEMWVTLLEKSFAKIMGSSYDMQGSNPGTDVFHLTGWLPETIPLSGSDRDMKSWNEIFGIAESGFREGRCIVCVGTSELSDAAPDAEARRLGHVEGVSVSTGLVARHAYPVLGCRRIGQHRLLHLKNPWGRIRWRGRFAPGDAEGWNDVMTAGGIRRLADIFGFDPMANGPDDGHFWIGWEDLLKHFSHLYLCWIPKALGLSQLVAHGSWNSDPHFARSTLSDDTHLVAFNPQFLLRLREPLPDGKLAGGVGSIWVLLSRHVQMRADIASRYVAVHIYKSNARLCCPDAPQEMGVYSNGECALVRLNKDQGQGQQEFVIVISQHASKVPFNYTLQVYSTIPGILTPLPPLVPDSFASGHIDGTWTAETAGGCSNNLWDYFRNPHWRLEIPAGGVRPLIIFVECPSEYSVNVRIFRGAVARPEHLRTVESSGAYRQGCCMLRIEDLPEGQYVAVVSTFRPGLLGSYRLAWHASQPIHLKPQPHPFAATPAEPLHSSKFPIAAGIRTYLRMKPVGSNHSNQHVLVSARLQCDFMVGLPPLMRLLLEAVSASSNPQCGDTSPLQPVTCESLSDSYAESYFASTGAAVILLAELPVGESRLLEVLAPSAGTGSTSISVNSDSPVILEKVVIAGVSQASLEVNSVAPPSAAL